MDGATDATAQHSIGMSGLLAPVSRWRGGGAVSRADEPLLDRAPMHARPATTAFSADLFKGKAAIVTGGGTGIGYAITRELLLLGSRVLICSRSEDKLRAALALHPAEASAGTLISHACNLRKEASVRACVTAATAAFGTIDFLVNNAGGQFLSPAEVCSCPVPVPLPRPSCPHLQSRSLCLGGFISSHGVRPSESPSTCPTPKPIRSISGHGAHWSEPTSVRARFLPSPPPPTTPLAASTPICSPSPPMASAPWSRPT
eukprot:scaffold3961_cov95-Isochrysis_galbana.AAC.2